MAVTKAAKVGNANAHGGSRLLGGGVDAGGAFDAFGGGAGSYRCPCDGAGAGLEFVEGDLGGHAGSGQCLGGAAALYNGRRGAVVLLGAEGGQDLSRSAR